MDTIKTQKYGVGKLLSTGWQLFLINFKNIFLVTLCVYLPIIIITSYNPFEYVGTAHGTEGQRFYTQISGLLTALFGLIATIGITGIIDKSLAGENLPWRDALRFGFSKWAPVFGTNVLGGLIILGLTLLLIVPGIIWGVFYLFSVYVVSLRNISGKNALDYSKNLVVGQWWRVFGINALLGIIGALFVVAITYLTKLISTNQFILIIPNFINYLVYSFIEVVMLLLFLNSDYLKNRPTDSGLQETPIVNAPQI
jgi:hypothetical protein